MTTENKCCPCLDLTNPDIEMECDCPCHTQLSDFMQSEERKEVYERVGKKANEKQKEIIDKVIKDFTPALEALGADNRNGYEPHPTQKWEDKEQLKDALKGIFTFPSENIYDKWVEFIQSLLTSQRQELNEKCVKISLEAGKELEKNVRQELENKSTAEIAKVISESKIGWVKEARQELKAEILGEIEKMKISDEIMCNCYYCKGRNDVHYNQALEDIKNIIKDK